MESLVGRRGRKSAMSSGRAYAMQQNSVPILCVDMPIVHRLDGVSGFVIFLLGSCLGVHGPYATHFGQTSLGRELER